MRFLALLFHSDFNSFDTVTDRKSLILIITTNNIVKNIQLSKALYISQLLLCSRLFCLVKFHIS